MASYGDDHNRLYLQVADAAQKKSEVSFRQARKAVDNFYTRVSEDTLLNQPGMQPLRRELLRQTILFRD